MVVIAWELRRDCVVVSVSSPESSDSISLHFIYFLLILSRSGGLFASILIVSGLLALWFNSALLILDKGVIIILERLDDGPSKI